MSMYRGACPTPTSITVTSTFIGAVAVLDIPMLTWIGAVAVPSALTVTSTFIGAVAVLLATPTLTNAGARLVVPATPIETLSGAVAVPGIGSGSGSVSTTRYAYDADVLAAVCHACPPKRYKLSPSPQNAKPKCLPASASGSG